ncbi:hypothetical protein EMGBS8_12620 [Verrucomicrobiota bacterium]|nr:hypothetical protein EMGBS8_12620 [Verrucomicrobiota bacterium]
MNYKKIILPALILLAGLAAAAWLLQGPHAHHDHDHGAHGHEAEEVAEAKGPHRGRLLTDGDSRSSSRSSKPASPQSFALGHQGG